MKRFLFYSKKTVCLLLVLILTAAFVPAVYAAEPEDALMKGTFTMTTFDGFDPGEQTFYYSDSYFTSSGKKSNEHLRTMSAALFPISLNCTARCTMMYCEMQNCFVSIT